MEERNQKEKLVVLEIEWCNNCTNTQLNNETKGKKMLNYCKFCEKEALRLYPSAWK